MKTLADQAEQSVLTFLEDQINKKLLTSGQAWACLSQPEKIKKFTPASGHFHFKFFDVEFKSLESLKQKLISHLDTLAGRRCSYCKRSMGKHGYSWQVEHIKCKSIFPSDTFSLRNLAFACVDCNMAKNHNVDNKKNNYIYDIIDPNLIGFKYSRHMKFLQISTETIHILKYEIRSKRGAQTHTKLRFSTLERCTAISSINSASRTLLNSIDDTLSNFAEKDMDEIGSFLFQLKERIFS